MQERLLQPCGELIKDSETMLEQNPSTRLFGSILQKNEYDRAKSLDQFVRIHPPKMNTDFRIHFGGGGVFPDKLLILYSIFWGEGCF